MAMYDRNADAWKTDENFQGILETKHKCMIHLLIGIINLESDIVMGYYNAL